MIDGIYVIGFVGELDLSTLPQLSDLLNKAMTQTHQHIALDLHGITVLDDAALGTPLNYDPSFHSRPYVDWIRVREILTDMNALL